MENKSKQQNDNQNRMMRIVGLLIVQNALQMSHSESEKER